jgi:hypothetical protein
MSDLFAELTLSSELQGKQRKSKENRLAGPSCRASE